MRQIGIRQLRANLSKELQQLPFNITDHGQVIATVTRPEQPQNTPNKDKADGCIHEWRGIKCGRPAIKNSKHCYTHTNR